MPVPPSRVPVRTCIALAACEHAVIGAALLLFFGDLLALLGAAVGPSQSAWQALGLLEAAFGFGLFLAVVWPRRHLGLVLAGIVVKVAGAAVVLGLLALQAVEVRGSALVLLAEVASALFLYAASRVLRRPQPVAPAAGPDPRALSTTTLFGLQQTLQALAAPASVQLSMFPELIANGGRVMEDFRGWQRRAVERQGALSDAQRQVLEGVTRLLEGMLREDARALWTADAVRSAREWGELRAAARRALTTFAWSVDMPMGLLRQKREEHRSVDLRPPG